MKSAVDTSSLFVTAGIKLQFLLAYGVAERETDRQTERQRDRETERDRERERDKEKQQVGIKVPKFSADAFFGGLFLTERG